MVFIILKVRIKMKRENKRGRGRGDEQATPPCTALRLWDRQLSRGWGEPILSSNLKPLCRFWWSHFERSHLRGHKQRRWIWCCADGFFFSFSSSLLQTHLKVITGAASSITSRNKHYNHVLHPSTKLPGNQTKKWGWFSLIVNGRKILGSPLIFLYTKWAVTQLQHRVKVSLVTKNDN